MSKLVTPETIWEFNLLIKMMSFVFYMRKAISKKISLKTVNN